MSSVPAEPQSLDADDANGVPVVKLVSKDGKTFDVERKSAFISQLVKTSLEQDSSTNELELTTPGSVLAVIVEYMKHHKGIEPPIVEKPLKSKVMRDVCKDPWDAAFVDKLGADRQFLYDLILAANYLHVNSLLHLACAKVAALIKGQPLDKIRDILSPDKTTRDASEPK